MSNPPITTNALWTWNTSGAGSPSVSGYTSGNNTKTGLQPSDLINFTVVPLQNYQTGIALTGPQLVSFIRYAEDWVEQETNILLCQTWVASPPAVTPAQCSAIGILPSGPSGFQQMGFDYDLEDAPYDFFYQRAVDEGWMALSLRYRPVKSVGYSPISPTAIKNTSYVYPLLNQFFNIPNAWNVEDHDYGYVRFVPATNVQMLPLFAIQLAFLGFAQSVPGGIWMQYTAGLTAADYQSRFAFIKQLVLCEAAAMALRSCQATINMGMEELVMQIDGISYKQKWPKNGPFGFQIEAFERQRDKLLQVALSKVAGPMMEFI